MASSEDLTAYEQVLGSLSISSTGQTNAAAVELAKKELADAQEKDLAVHGAYIQRYAYHFSVNSQTGEKGLQVGEPAFRLYQDGFILFGQNTRRRIPASTAVAIFSHLRSQPYLGQGYRATTHGEVVYKVGQGLIKLPCNHPLELIYTTLFMTM